MLLWLLLFLWLPLTEGKSPTGMCTMTDPFQMPHEYYKAGDFNVGAIVTVFGSLFDEISFTEDPNTMTLNRFT